MFPHPTNGHVKIEQVKECIPVGCILPALVATTRCQYGRVHQKAITEGHFQPEGQYQKVTFSRMSPPRLKVAFCYGLLAESGLLLWPSGVSSP